MATKAKKLGQKTTATIDAGAGQRLHLRRDSTHVDLVSTEAIGELSITVRAVPALIAALRRLVATVP